MCVGKNAAQNSSDSFYLPDIRHSQNCLLDERGKSDSITKICIHCSTERML